MNQILDGARTILCLSFLIYASWSDYKTREVSNKVWIILGPSAFALTAFQFVVFDPELILSYVISFAVTSILALIIFYAGGFGGADAKALLCISLVLPVYPSYFLPQPSGLFSPLFPLTIFTNSVLLGALTVFYSLFRNLLWMARNRAGLFDGLEKESLSRKILVLLSGYKIQFTKLKNAHMFPLEDVQVDDEMKKKNKLLVFPKDEEREEIVTRLQENSKEGKTERWVWATPGLPLLIFITAGLAVALIYGDIIWMLLNLLF